jgi:hypothetical protein
MPYGSALCKFAVFDDGWVNLLLVLTLEKEHRIA